jgi:hypothetical protein
LDEQGENTMITPSNAALETQKPLEPMAAHEDPALIMARRFGITTTTRGAAFSGSFKCISILIAVAIIYWGWQALPILNGVSLSTQAKVVLGACMALVLYTLYYVMISQTTVTPTEISQNFIFNRRVHLGEVSFAKFIYIPYLTWLIAPRLFVRTASNKFAAFYGAHRDLHQVFGQIHRTVAQGSK